MDGRKGPRRFREPPLDTRSSRRGRLERLRDGSSSRVRENRYHNPPGPPRHHHQGHGYERQSYNGGYDGNEGAEVNIYGSGHADSIQDSGYDSLHQPPTVNSGVPAAAVMEAGLMLLTEWASNLTHGTSSPSYHNQSEDTYHDRSLPCMRENDYPDLHHNPIPPHHSENQYSTSETYHSSCRQGTAHNFVGHGHIPVNHARDNHGRVLLETPLEYDGGDEGYIGHGHVPVENSERADYDGQFSHHRHEDSIHTRGRDDYRYGGHPQQGFDDFDSRNSGRRHSVGMEADYDDSGFSGRHRHGSDMGFDDRHHYASGASFDHNNGYSSSDHQYHHERDSYHDSSGPTRDYPPNKAGFNPNYRVDDQPFRYSQRKRSSSEIKYRRKPDLPPKRSRLDLHDHHSSSIDSATRSHDTAKYTSSTLAPKKHFIARHGPSEGRDSDMDFAGSSDFNVSERLGPSTIQSRLGPKQEPNPVLPDLRTKLNGRNNSMSDSPIPLFPPCLSTDPPVVSSKPLLKMSSKERPLPNLSVPDYLKPGSLKGSPQGSPHHAVSGSLKGSPHHAASGSSKGSPHHAVSGSSKGSPVHSVPGKVSGKSPDSIAAAYMKDFPPPTLKDPGPVPLKPLSKEPLVSKSPYIDSQKKKIAVKVVKVVQKSGGVAVQAAPRGSVKIEDPVSVESDIGLSGSVPQHASPSEPSQQHAIGSTTDSIPISVGPAAKPSLQLHPEINNPEFSSEPGEHQTHPLHVEVSDPRLKGRSDPRQHQPSPTTYKQPQNVSDSGQLEEHPGAGPSEQPQQSSLSRPLQQKQPYGAEQQHADLGLGDRGQIGIAPVDPEHGECGRVAVAPALQLVDPRRRRVGIAPAPHHADPRLGDHGQVGVAPAPHHADPRLSEVGLAPAPHHADPRLSDRGQVCIAPAPQHADPRLSDRGRVGVAPANQQLVNPTTAIVSDVGRDSGSDRESDDCGLVIDEDACLCDTEGSERGEEDVPEPAAVGGEHPAIQRLDEDDEGVYTVWDAGDGEGEVPEASRSEPSCEQQSSGGMYHTDRTAMRIAGSMLSRVLIEQLSNEGNLLQKLYDAMKVLVRFLNGHGSWHVGFVGHIRKMFQCYRIAAAPSPTKLKDQFHLELKHLRNLCGSNVNLWQEQIQRFSLLSLTFPKNKEDRRMEGFADPVTGKLIVISDDEGSWKKRAVKGKGSFQSSIPDPVDQPVVRGTDDSIGLSKPAQVQSPGVRQDSSTSTGQSAPVAEQAADSDGECSMSVCSTLSNSFDMDESRSCHTEEERGPDLRRWTHAQERLERCSVDLHVGAGVALGGNGQVTEEPSTPEIPKPPQLPKPPERPPLPPLPPAPTTPPRPPTPDSPLQRAASLSPGELTPTPPSSPKPASRASTSASYDMPSSANRSSQREPPKRKAVKLTTRPHLQKPAAYRSPPASRSRARFQRSRDRYGHSRRSRSPITRGRQRESRSPPSRAHGYRKHSLSISPEKGCSKGKGKVQRRKTEEDDLDLELLQLKKEAILSIVQKSEASETSQAASPSSDRSTPPLPPSARKDSSSISSLPSASKVPLPLRKKTSVKSLLPVSKSTDTPSLPSTSKVSSARKNVSSPKSSGSKSSSSVSSKDAPLLPPSKKDASSKETASRVSVAAQVSVGSEVKETTSIKRSTASAPAKSTPSDPSSDRQVSLLAKKVMMGLAKKAIAKTLERPTSSGGVKSAHSSLSSSCVGSRVASPVGSPAHTPTALSGSEEAPGRSSSSCSVKPTASVKVCPGKENTWKIQPFHITSSGAESDSGGEGKGEVGLSEIGELLAEARKAAAAQASVSSSSSSKTSSMEDLNLPSPPPNLSLNQQQEYMQLKRKLALHEKKRLKDHKYTSSGAKIGLIGLKIASGGSKGVASKPPLPAARLSPAHSWCSSPPRTTSESSKSQEKAAEERRVLVLECQGKISATAEKLKGSRAQEEEEQQKITALTNQLTECVSEIVEHEQVMVRVQQQLALLRREQEMVDVALKGCEQRISELQDNVRSAQQKKAEKMAEVKEFERVMAEQEKELKLVQEGKRTSVIPAIEYENVSDSEVPSLSSGRITSTAVPGDQAEYEAISDSEGTPVPTPLAHRLAAPAILVEPISDTEDYNESSPMETEPVSDVEVEPLSGILMMRSTIQFPPVDTESITDTEPDIEVAALRDHGYCKYGSVLPAESVGVASPDSTGVLSSIRDADVYIPMDGTTNRPVLSPRDPLPSYLVMSEVDHEDLTAVSGKVLPVVRQKQDPHATEAQHSIIVGEVMSAADERSSPASVQVAMDGAADERPSPASLPVAMEVTADEQSSPALINALQVALEGALTPTLKSLGQLHPLVTEPPSAVADKSDCNQRPPDDKIKPLLNSVAARLTQEYIQNIVLSRETVVCNEGSSSASPSSSYHELDMSLESYFHPCHDGSFTHPAEEPPSYIIPRQSFTHDLSLPVEASSISNAAMHALQEGLSFTNTVCRSEREDSVSTESSPSHTRGLSGEKASLPIIIAVEGSPMHTDQQMPGPASSLLSRQVRDNTLLSPMPVTPPSEICEERGVEVEIPHAAIETAQVVTPPCESGVVRASPRDGAGGMPEVIPLYDSGVMELCPPEVGVMEDVTPPPESFPALMLSEASTAEGLGREVMGPQRDVTPPLEREAADAHDVTPSRESLPVSLKSSDESDAGRMIAQDGVIILVDPVKHDAKTSDSSCPSLLTPPLPVSGQSTTNKRAASLLQKSPASKKLKLPDKSASKSQYATVKVVKVLPSTSKSPQPAASKAAAKLPEISRSSPGNVVDKPQGKRVTVVASKASQLTSGKATVASGNVASSKAQPAAGKAVEQPTSKAAQLASIKAQPPATSKAPVQPAAIKAAASKAPVQPAAIKDAASKAPVQPATIKAQPAATRKAPVQPAAIKDAASKALVQPAAVKAQPAATRKAPVQPAAIKTQPTASKAAQLKTGTSIDGPELEPVSKKHIVISSKLGKSVLTVKRSTESSAGKPSLSASKPQVTANQAAKLQSAKLQASAAKSELHKSVPVSDKPEPTKSRKLQSTSGKLVVLNKLTKSQPTVGKSELTASKTVKEAIPNIIKGQKSGKDSESLPASEKARPTSKPGMSVKSAASSSIATVESQPSTSHSTEKKPIKEAWRPSDSCARTSGWVKPKPLPPPVAPATSNPASGAEGNSVKSLLVKILSIKDFPTALGIDYVSSASTEAVTGGNHFSLFSFSTNYWTLSQLPPPMLVPDNILTEIGSAQSATPTASHTPSGYTAYSSPLLMFTSYRLNPAFRSLSKIPLGSLTYSSKLDPNKVMCMYELKGVCSNSKCTAQHFRDLAMEKEDVVKDLVSYAPTLAGCTAEELAMAAADQPQVTDTISGKISTYTTELLEKYGDKVSDEELYRLTVHEANTERVKTKAKKNFVFLEDRPWAEDMVQGTPRPPSERVYQLEVQSGGEAAGPEGLELGRGLTGTLPRSEERRRYFTVDNTPALDSDQGSSKQFIQDAARKLTEPTNTAGGNGGPKPDDQLGSSQEVVAAVRQLIVKRQFIVATTMLEKAVETHSDSEDVWILHLQLKSQLASSAELPELYQLFHTAVSSCQRYAVIWETIRLARCYKSKLKAVCDGLHQLRIADPSHLDPAVLSTLCLELFINAILLDLLIGKPSAALRHFDQARASLEAAPTAANFKGVLDVLVQREKLLFSLCHISVLYMGQLPGCLFSADAHHVVPARLCHFQPFAVPFDKTNQLSPRDYKQVLRALKLYFDLYQPQSSGNDSLGSSLPHAKVVEQNLPLYKNLVLFEAAHGNNQKAVNMLRKLITVCPHISDLWHTLPRMRELSGVDSMTELEHATSTCPRKPELYYFAARLELSRAADMVSVGGASPARRGVDSSCEAAVQWLVRCARNYYTGLQEQLSTKEVLILYRKLLNQMIRYNQTVPVLAGGVDPRGLGDQLAPLWMCYCLLVELTVPPSTPTTPGAELFHPSAEEAYESAIHTVQSAAGHCAIWREYILYVRAKGVETAQGFRRLMNCVQRCVLDVPWTRPLTHPLAEAVIEDYSFHNEMIDILMVCLPPSSALKLSLLRKFSKHLPNNSELLEMVVRCALQQEPPCTDVAQSSVAEYLSLHPCSPHMWKLAIETELQLKHTREARWMFNKALESVPISSKLWIDFLVFELKQAVTSTVEASTAASPATIQRIIALVRNAHQYGIDLVSVLRQLATKAS